MTDAIQRLFHAQHTHGQPGRSDMSIPQHPHQHQLHTQPRVPFNTRTLTGKFVCNTNAARFGWSGDPYFLLLLKKRGQVSWDKVPVYGYRPQHKPHPNEIRNQQVIDSLMDHELVRCVVEIMELKNGGNTVTGHKLKLLEIQRYTPKSAQITPTPASANSAT